ncbi:Ig-like domain-containing protein, partial [Mycolicibacterium pulveris]
MNAAAYVGRVGSLAVALGVGIAVATGYGAGMAWADPSATGASSAESSETEASSTGAGDPAEPASAEEVDPESETDLEDESELELEIEDESEPDAEDESELEPESEADVEVDPEPQEEPETAPEAEPEPEPEAEAEPEAGQPDGADEAPAEEPVEPSLTATSNAARFDAGEDVTGKAAFDDTVGAAVPETTAVTITSFAAQTMSPTAANIPLNSPAFPSLRPWPTAFDPATAITYVTGIVFSLVNAVLAPFAAGLPAPPSGPPTVWTLLAWVRRELFNSTPHVSAELPPYTQSLVDGEVIITGNVGITDPDGDPMFFTVVGRPLNGGVVDVDADGNFTYRPMNAMAAVGGWDAFTVVADDQAAGLHVHGPGGLLQFVPIV